MSYTLHEVDEAEDRIRRECPNVITDRVDFGWGLYAAKDDQTIGFIVFMPERIELNQGCVIGDVDKIIAALNSE